MKMKKLVVEAKDFNNVKEIIYNSANCYGEQTAFVIKHKNGKDIEYENITYSRFLDDINKLARFCLIYYSRRILLTQGYLTSLNYR